MDKQSADEKVARTISLIDNGIKSLGNLTFPRELLHINLHCNEIGKIENLQSLVFLRSLDLSSNEIKVIEGLESLANLQVLNLASNQIQVVAGLSSLRKLEKLNLSYNDISDLTGLKDFRRNTHVLKYVELHGNRISSLKHVVECIANCGTIEVLSFSRSGDSNPVCSVPAYRPTIFAQLPKLQILDGRDKHGNITTLSDLDLLHPGLNDYLQWLVESNHSDSNTTSERSEEQVDLQTPKIDEVLQRFKSKGDGVPRRRQDISDSASQEELSGKTHLTEKLGFLERQIETLLSLQLKSQMVPEKDIATTTQTTSSDSVQERAQVSKLPQRKYDSKRKLGAKERQRLAAVQKGTKEERSVSSDRLQEVSRKIRDPKDDEAALMLMKELDEERERRWKAEQATRRLVNTVKEMQEKLGEERRIAESAISTSAKLKAGFASERDQRLKLEKSLDEQKVKSDELTEELKKYRQYETEAKQIIASLEETSRNSERERLKVQSIKDKQLQEAQFKAAASHREAELLKENEKNLKIRINQLQELVANREQDHKNTLEGLVKIDGKEVKDVVDKEMAKQEGRYAQLMQQLNERIESRNRDYAMLEDEFRTGLQMEANRFTELQSAFAQLTDEASDWKKSYQILKQKESKATSLVSELTSMVKEQKGRLEEISKSKQEMQLSFKERTSALESQLEICRKQLSKMENLKQERDKLLAQCKAQESVIEGLRTERKLWGEELAKQGASLAHDRGRLEAQIDSLTNEVKHLKQREQENLDGLKIKSKLIEDQTDSIQKLKQEIADKRGEMKKLNDRAAAETKLIEKELAEERLTCNELQEVVEGLKARKEELKIQLGSNENELQKTKSELKNLKNKWEERSQLIAQLEEKVFKMKENFDSKEQKLMEERDTALKATNEIRAKLKTCDDSFRRQLEENRREHDLQIRKLIAEKDDEINHAKLKVSEVEDEMRSLLEEKATSKRNFEQKIQQLSRAFAEIQQGLHS